MSIIQWYPGHISKAERQLKEQIKNIDIIFEILDARIPIASHHPNINQWIEGKPKITVLNRMDMIPQSLYQKWLNWFKERGETAHFTDAKQGKGIKSLNQLAKEAGNLVNIKRVNRGMRPRAVRAVVIGFPNVGKSALINRLLGRKVAISARRAGVTRQLQWIRISKTIELLDAPGVIPVKLENQKNAIKLAICEDIGEAAYDNQQVAAKLIDLLLELNFEKTLQLRYGIDPLGISGEQYIEKLESSFYKGGKERVAMQLLNDFRKGIMGCIPLELPKN